MKKINIYIFSLKTNNLTTILVNLINQILKEIVSKQIQKPINHILIIKINKTYKELIINKQKIIIILIIKV